MDVTATSSLELPEAFLDFLSENGLDPSIYTASDTTPRYIRLKPGCEAYLEEIEAEIECKLEKVTWLPNFYSLPPHIQIANSKAYQEGKIYGIDAASGASVTALDISLGDHILDLCAAPGAKLCMISDLLGGSGSVTGVDVARHRLAACRTMLQKYALGDRCRLFVADGTTFSLIPVRVHQNSETLLNRESALKEKLDVYKEWTSRRNWKERKTANKERENGKSLLVPQTQDPELIFYGLHSGVVGLSKSELYHNANGSEVSHRGYDKTPGLNVITGYIIGYLYPGYPVANMCFKVYGYISMKQAILFLQDFKLGHYMKIPPRSMFMAQVVGSLISALVHIGTAWWLMSTVPDICDRAVLPAASPWTCPSDHVFYDASVIWGLIGPQRIFGNLGYYAAINWFFLVGAILPLLVWLAHKAFPSQHWIKLISAPVILGGVINMPPATAVNYTSWIIIGFLSGFVAYRYYRNWWSRHNYVLSGALDAGLAFMGVLLYLCMDMEHLC